MESEFFLLKRGKSERQTVTILFFITSAEFFKWSIGYAMLKKNYAPFRFLAQGIKSKWKSSVSDFTHLLTFFLLSYSNFHTFYSCIFFFYFLGHLKHTAIRCRTGIHNDVRRL